MVERILSSSISLQSVNQSRGNQRLHLMRREKRAAPRVNWQKFSRRCPKTSFHSLNYSVQRNMAPKTGLSVGLAKGHVTTERAMKKKASTRKGVSSTGIISLGA